MIPIKDDNPKTTFPVMNILLILANIAVFVYQVRLGSGIESFIYRFGTIPWEITHFQELPGLQWEFRTIFPNILTLVTSMFLHGGVLHLLGNLLYLWIFGDNVEALVGHWRYLLFYLLCGIIATLTHITMEPNSTIPMIGASGAISGILGSYFISFPRARVHVLLVFFFLFRVVRVSALFVLGFWFLLQVLNGFGTLGIRSGGGVAWFAHIGGFVAGMFLILFFKRKGKYRVNRSRKWR